MLEEIVQDERNVRIVIDYEDGRCNSFSRSETKCAAAAGAVVAARKTLKARTEFSSQ